MSLLILGSVAFDALETPFGSIDRIIGGSATYISIASTFYPIQAGLLGIVGSDFPAETIAMLQQRSVDTTGLQVVPGGKTFFWKGRYHLDMNTRDTLATELNVFEHFEPQVPSHWQRPSVLMLGNIGPGTQLQVLQQLQQRPQLVVADTMNLWINIARPELNQVIAQVDVLCLNDEEARMLTGEHNLVKAAKAILAMGPHTCVIKKGEHGALLFQGSQVFFCPALPLEDVFDPTGAGDTFVGGFVGYLASTGDFSFENMKQAVVQGSALASVCVEAFGPNQLLTLSHEQLKQRSQQFVQLVQCSPSTTQA